MNSPGPAVARRALLGMAVLASLAACTRGTPPPSPSTPPPPPPSTTRQFHDRLMELEKKFGARLGVYAVDTGGGATIEHRADERFAFCSTFKGVAAAAVLQRNPLSHLETRVEYSRDDLVEHAPVTGRHVATGMTIRQLCDAAIRFSDGTAGNLLLRDAGLDVTHVSEGVTHVSEGVTHVSEGVTHVIEGVTRVSGGVTSLITRDTRPSTRVTR